MGSKGTEGVRAMIRYFILGVAVSALLSAGSVMADDGAKENAAVLAAQHWLAMVDGEKYAKSWEEAAEYFKGAVTREQWEQSLRGVRKPLGEVVSRKVKSKTYVTSLPGAPDGEYVVIQFETSFENKKSAVETVTPMMDTDDKWRVSGYYIK
jgi:hypothetical protein